ncbi:hypothetical protein [Halovivax sp.]|uniref:hypothetical protein n=1 Tax=Halovivax sp. TaxID=1935978 RepID=UPI0025B89C1B|nr:hypothetical protein [Halovivax sp.]
MSDSHTTTERESRLAPKTPRAVVHKQILDAAASRPEASMEAIADEVSGANVGLVEQVLEEYGDPAVDAEDHDQPSPNHAAGDGESAPTDDGESAPTDDDGESAPTDDDGAAAVSAANDPTPSETSPEPTDPSTAMIDASSASDAEVEPTIDFSSLTEKQRETLREIHRLPDATQSRLADRLGVTGATISQRLSGIEGFDWSRREELVDELVASEDLDVDRADALDERATDGADDGRDQRTADSAETAVDGGSNANGSKQFDDDDGGDEDESVGGKDESLGGEDESVGDESNGDQTQERGDRTPSTTGATGERSPSSTEAGPSVNHLAARFESLRRRVDAMERNQPNASSTASVFDDPELAHKIIHACFDADYVTEDEEVEIIETVVSGPAGGGHGSPDSHETREGMGRDDERRSPNRIDRPVGHPATDDRR